MDDLVVSQSRIFMAQPRNTQAKTAAHDGGATASFPACRPALQLQLGHSLY
jgi:hypothetical protein